MTRILGRILVFDTNLTQAQDVVNILLPDPCKLKCKNLNLPFGVIGHPFHKDFHVIQRSMGRSMMNLVLLLLLLLSMHCFLCSPFPST
jgi:hypothetical protein